VGGWQRQAAEVVVAVVGRVATMAPVSWRHQALRGARQQAAAAVAAMT